ncbi:MAG: hypothetical protein WAK51_13440 [Opitutaceae bacterium]
MRCREAILACGFWLLQGLPAGAAPLVAVGLPDPRVPGFQFPESEATILTWVHAMGSGSPEAAAASNNVILHGWGLWTALTLETSQIDNGDPLRVFETWYTPQEIDPQPTVNGQAAAPVAAALLAPRHRAALRNFAQFEHGLEPRDRELLAQTSGSETVFGYVKFDPTAAAHVAAQRLLSAASLNALLDGGAQQVPVFPQTALTLKAAFQIITAKTLVGGRYYRLNAWTGPPAKPQAWAPYQWPGVVWIDIQGGGSGSGQVDLEASTDGGSRTAQTTYPVSSMINHRISALEAAEFNRGQPGSDVQPGDYAVLVAMHVAGREIARWTWQTFWWSPTPDDPQAPSSQGIAGLRPAQLAGAARNYAMAIGYDMTTPSQPNTGGQNSGAAIYAYNPYLEARFGPASLPDSEPGEDPSGQPSENNVGVNCNCMSCHIRANYNPNNLATAPRYSGARYTDMNDPQFAGTLQVDLLWSLPEIAN